MRVFEEDAEGNLDWHVAERSGVLYKLVDKGAKILLKYENYTFSLQQEQLDLSAPRRMLGEDMDRHNFRENKFSDIFLKTRGVYAPVRDAVLVKAQEHGSTPSTSASLAEPSSSSA